MNPFEERDHPGTPFAMPRQLDRRHAIHVDHRQGRARIHEGIDHLETLSLGRSADFSHGEVQGRVTRLFVREVDVGAVFDERLNDLDVSVVDRVEQRGHPMVV
eukprot:2309530-Prymnesium_polylepis.3